jgi:hypothetical protein
VKDVERRCKIVRPGGSDQSEGRFVHLPDVERVSPGMSQASGRSDHPVTAVYSTGTQYGMRLALDLRPRRAGCAFREVKSLVLSSGRFG